VLATVRILMDELLLSDLMVREGIGSRGGTQGLRLEDFVVRRGAGWVGVR